MNNSEQVGVKDNNGSRSSAPCSEIGPDVGKTYATVEDAQADCLHSFTEEWGTPFVKCTKCGHFE